MLESVEAQFNNFIAPEDIVRRLMRRGKIFWFHGKPVITLVGEQGSFGELCFDFVDEKIQYRIYLHNKKIIEDAAYLAIYNFAKLYKDIMSNK